jgi:hypothetical protein
MGAATIVGWLAISCVARKSPVCKYLPRDAACVCVCMREVHTCVGHQYNYLHSAALTSDQACIILAALATGHDGSGSQTACSLTPKRCALIEGFPATPNLECSFSC